VKHLDRRGQRGHLVIGPAPFHGQPHPALGQRASRPGSEVDQRGKGARDHHVMTVRDRLDPGMSPAQVGQRQRAGDLLHEGRLLAHRVHAADVDVRAADGDHHARQPAAAAHVQQAQRPPTRMRLQRRDHGQTVHQVLHQHLLRLAHRRQVVDLVPPGQQVQIGQQLVDPPIVQRQAQGLHPGAQCQRLRMHQAASAAVPAKPLKPPFFRWISSSETAAGVTPLIRLAWPRVSGRCRLSFCRTSIDNAGTCM